VTRRRHKGGTLRSNHGTKGKMRDLTTRSGHTFGGERKEGPDFIKAWASSQKNTEQGINGWKANNWRHSQKGKERRPASPREKSLWAKAGPFRREKNLRDSGKGKPDRKERNARA